MLIWDTAALRGAHQAPVSCLALLVTDVVRWSLPDSLQAKMSKHCIPVLQRGWDEPSALMSHGRSVAAVS